MERPPVLIMGAARKDFHNFNLVFRDDPRYDVIAFTASQIPNIQGRSCPPELSGSLYANGIPIYTETDLEPLVEQYQVNLIVFSCSAVSHDHVMHAASRVVAIAVGFKLLGARSTMLPSTKPVVSVCAMRTGCGKSPVTRKIDTPVDLRRIINSKQPICPVTYELAEIGTPTLRDALEPLLAKPKKRTGNSTANNGGL